MTDIIENMLPTIDVQSWLQLGAFLPSYLKLTGTDGPATETACVEAAKKLAPLFKNWDADRSRAAVEQIMLKDTTKYDLGPIDGRVGTRTLYALELYHNAQRDLTLGTAIVAASAAKTDNPRQKDVKAWLGEAGSERCRKPMNIPYHMRMDGSLSKSAKIPLGQPGAPNPITRIAVHELLHPQLLAILTAVWDHYGNQKLQELGIDQYAGSYNYRPMRGGTSLSMHAYGAAIDLDAQRNSLHETAATARFAHAEYKPLIECFYDHGWISLGKERNFDWMHFQALRL